MACDFLNGRQEPSDVGRGDLADVHLREKTRKSVGPSEADARCESYLSDHRDDRAAEAAEEGRREHGRHRLREHRDDPRQRERQRHDGEDASTAVLQEEAAEEAPEQGAQQRQARYPAGLLVGHRERRVVATLADLQVLQAGDRRTRIPFAEARRQRPQ